MQINDFSRAVNDINQTVDNIYKAINRMVTSVDRLSTSTISTFDTMAEAFRTANTDLAAFSNIAGGATLAWGIYNKALINANATNRETVQVTSSLNSGMKTMTDRTRTAKGEVTGFKKIMTRLGEVIKRGFGSTGLMGSSQINADMRTLADSTRTAKTELTGLKKAKPGLIAMGKPALGLVALVAVFAAITQGLPALVKWFKESANAANELHIAVDELRYGTNKLTEATAISREVHEKRIKSIIEETRVSRELLDQLKELYDAEGRFIGSKDDLMNITNKLNDSMHELNLQYDIETGYLNKSLTTIGNLITIRDRLARATAHQELATELARKQLDIYEQLAEIEKRRADVSESIADKETRNNQIANANEALKIRHGLEVDAEKLDRQRKQG
ncbi:MAG: hypothetical protein FWC91_14705, partial [Defluviitaleaceae bacterium]|nr:hypothetical protein [Defluviitaleaceae bacterium]